ncbi:hypothetical protein GUJ93_ZPchr0458g22716 [Zizania palustris]|uniref:FMN-dependent dehydrogenase domain-containing protein n=1 Tax=Zizania palustris TaxID=103762 RepID=A0A8J5UZP6_ZIZPA|nr:hypothetical protein GUJ93_ZPchr0458g22716 [Zizania palustris]KAG8043546.1 hypothetical protein GUJ93_ZPchr0458g22716 [Zizania palustris]
MALVTNMCAYEELVKQKLPKMVYDFFACGTEDQWTLRKNREAFSRILFVGRWRCFALRCRRRRGGREDAERRAGSHHDGAEHVMHVLFSAVAISILVLKEA